MGITGLIEELGSTVVRDTTLDQLGLSGKKVGIDAMIWLVAVKELLIKKEPRVTLLPREERERIQADRFMAYCERMFELLKKRNIKYMLVFDGNATPRKTEIQLLKKKIQEGRCDSDGDEKVNYDKPKSMFIPDRERVRKWFIKEDVEFIVAPYEADAQLTYLAIKGKIDAVITEDTDLIPFGCPRVIFKLDADTLTCQDYAFNRLKYHKKYRTFIQKMLLEMCIIIGCDYLPNLEGTGKSRASDAVLKRPSYIDLIPYYENPLKLRIGAEKYETCKEVILKEFQKAIKAYTYQQVYDPDSHTCERLSHMDLKYNLLREDADKILGPCLKDEAVHIIATGIKSSEIEKTYIVENTSDKRAGAKRKPSPFITGHFKRLDDSIDGKRRNRES
ncbi:PREDICTED: exonuclease 1-like [Fragaria vesca subsp. vesca]|uniref:exonuclease 1-like n=1 Tax=Fragaria vesca subsp. vesca TaxID=101020 RepID=UPI0002C36AA8|nr:PREDICTED: exonuclease 1-like [Fragaria vesca subsp. vesca]